MKVALFVAVALSATVALANLPQPILSLALNKPVGQIVPVTITNVGSGYASTVVLTAPSPGPEIDVVYKNGQPIAADCSTVMSGSTLTRVCILRAALQPGEMLQVHYRSAPLCTGEAPTGRTEIRAATPDELPPGNHMVDLRQACAP